MIYFYTKHKTKLKYFFPILFIGGLTFAAISFNTPPLFDNTDNFILFAQEEVKLESDTQISSGDIGSNNQINIDKDTIINGNLYSDNITLDKNTQINGNISFNKLNTHKETQIFGAQTDTVSLPIANLPQVPIFPIGNQNLTFTGENNTLQSGDYQNITLKKDSRLVLTGGLYNLSRLFINENSTLIFATSTTINIQQELKAQQNISILPDQNLTPDDLIINYQGQKGKQKGQGTSPIHFGRNSFLNFKLIAPKADVHIGEATTLRGQVLARKVFVGKGSVLSREVFFSKDTDPDKIIIIEGEEFPVNEIIVVMSDNTTFFDAQAVSGLVNGRIIGFIPEPQIYKIEVLANTSEELDGLIESINQQQNPLILFVIKNLAGGLQ